MAYSSPFYQHWHGLPLILDFRIFWGVNGQSIVFDDGLFSWLNLAVFFGCGLRPSDHELEPVLWIRFQYTANTTIYNPSEVLGGFNVARFTRQRGRIDYPFLNSSVGIRKGSPKKVTPAISIESSIKSSLDQAREQEPFFAFLTHLFTK